MAGRKIYVSQGATLRVRLGLGFDHTNFDITSTVQGADFSSALSVRKIDPFKGGIVEVSAAPEQTALWRKGAARFDLRCEANGEVVTSKNYIIIVTKGATT